MQQIVIKDGATTPTDHTFTPYTPQMGSLKSVTPAVWYERSGTSPLGWRRITMSVEVNVSGISKVRIVISDPVLAAIDNNCCVDANTPVVSYTDFANIVFSLPFKATESNRKDILAFAKNLLGNSVVTDAIVNLLPPV